jgi:hypothetical protein
MAKITLAKNFRGFLKLLRKHRVKYAVIGGYAVAVHGHPRATGNLDIFVELSDKNAAQLARAFTEFGFGGPDVNAALFSRPGKIIRIGRPPERLEVMNEISGVTFAECYAHRVIFKDQDLLVAFIDLERLVRNKRATGRLRDLADIENLPPPAEK